MTKRKGFSRFSLARYMKGRGRKQTNKGFEQKGGDVPRVNIDRHYQCDVTLYINDFQNGGLFLFVIFAKDVNFP